VAWAGREAIVLSAIELSPGQPPAAGPGTMWGCEEAHSNARVAFIEISGSPSARPILIHGTVGELTAGLIRA
jgi:hypothetical protein